MSRLGTSAILINVISSPAPAGGASRYDSQGGTTAGQYGQDRVRASRGQEPGASAALRTIDTSGPNGFGSFESVALQRSLESRLRAREFGSTVYSLTWKVWVTPAGRRICRLRASAPRKIAPGCGFWPTPRAAGGKAGPDYAKTDRSSTGISLPTALGGMPNPTWLAWLMGYPEQWISAAYLATRSFRSSQPNLL